MNWKPVRYSDHAAARRRAHRVSFAEVRRVLAVGTLVSAKGDVPERVGPTDDGRELKVVYREGANAIYVITVHIMVQK